jgi:hypothetical protein
VIAYSHVWRLACNYSNLHVSYQRSGGEYRLLGASFFRWM